MEENYTRSTEDAAPSQSHGVLGIWADKVPYLDSEYTDLRDIGISSLAVMCSESSTIFKARPALKKIELIAEKCLLHGLELTATFWPPHHPGEDFYAAIRACCEAGVSAIELDVEGQLKGADLEREGPEIARRVGELVRDYDTRLDVTSHPGHRESHHDALITPHAQRFYLQSYSIASHEEQVRIPGAWQNRTIESWVDASTGWHDRPKLGVGLAIWNQSYPGMSAEQAVKRAVEAARSWEPVEIRFWSRKWLSTEMMRIIEGL